VECGKDSAQIAEYLAQKDNLLVQSCKGFWQPWGFEILSRQATDVLAAKNWRFVGKKELKRN
jgi:hypothetical protein